MEHENQADVLFYEPYAAAQSLKNFWTRLASTYGCMQVSLTPRTLIIKPHGLANWLIFPLGLNLNHEIPVADIKSAVERGAWFGHGKVEVHFGTNQGEEQAILLYLKKHTEFIQQVNDLLHSQTALKSEHK